MKKGSCIAVFGTGSDVGKSIVAAALCRILSDLEVAVAPYKAQNMSNNSRVTPEGGEIGTAQAVQAECARLAPSVHMNPLLLKPQGGNRSQTVVLGKVAGETSAADFRTQRNSLFETAQKSLDRLRSEYEAVVIEGAGSCAEVNLRGSDLANFRTAISCGAPVLLVADISRGGVFAQVIGTMNLLQPEERRLVKGIVINRFKGDVSLFRDGVEFIERETGVPVLGVIPHFSHIDIDPEDSVVLDALLDPAAIAVEGKINVGVVKFPHISNFTDFASLLREPAVHLSYLERPRDCAGLDLLVLPGSKNTREDLRWLLESGWRDRITAYRSGGGRIAGICGGYQMLGRSVEDPYAVEGSKGISEGLALLDAVTVLGSEKTLTVGKGKWVDGGYPVSGYEIHMGKTEPGRGVKRPVEIRGDDGSMHPDGAVTDDGKVWGTYLHGIFDEPVFRRAFMATLKNGKELADGPPEPNPAEFRNRQYDLLADHFRKYLDMKAVLELVAPESAGRQITVR